MYSGNKKHVQMGGKSVITEEDPFVVINEDGSVSREEFNSEYLASLSVPSHKRDKIKVVRKSSLA